MEHARSKVARRWAPVLVGAPAIAGMTLAGLASAGATTPAGRRSSPPAVVHESLVLLDGGMTDHSGWPQIVGGKSIALPAHTKVELTIYSFDTGTAPLTKSLEIYDKVLGTIGGSETINGKTASSLANKDVSHTFTVPSIGLNLVIPVATSSKRDGIQPAVVTATFETSKTGTFAWHCYAPCGSGSDGMGGPMVMAGYMTGDVVIG